MSGVPDAGGSYVRQPDGSLMRVERTLGPGDLPDPETPDKPLPPAPADPEEES